MGRVGGQLAVTRSIGDHALKTQGIIPTPTTKRFVIRTSDRWIIIASDGVWDVLTEMNISEIIGHKDEKSEILAQKIVKAALEKGSRDNITCLTIKL